MTSASCGHEFDPLSARPQRCSTAGTASAEGIHQCEKLKLFKTSNISPWALCSQTSPTLWPSLCTQLWEEHSVAAMSLFTQRVPGLPPSCMTITSSTCFDKSHSNKSSSKFQVGFHLQLSQLQVSLAKPQVGLSKVSQDWYPPLVHRCLLTKVLENHELHVFCYIRTCTYVRIGAPYR